MRLTLLGDYTSLGFMKQRVVLTSVYVGSCIFSNTLARSEIFPLAMQNSLSDPQV